MYLKSNVSCRAFHRKKGHQGESKNRSHQLDEIFHSSVHIDRSIGGFDHFGKDFKPVHLSRGEPFFGQNLLINLGIALRGFIPRKIRFHPLSHQVLPLFLVPENLKGSFQSRQQFLRMVSRKFETISRPGEGIVIFNGIIQAPTARTTGTVPYRRL
jgi:hypothetical protein